jgi:ZIP family zinc transporter
VVEALKGLSPVLQALIATIFTWGVTALGAAGVFTQREINKKVLNAMLGFAAGVMIAASFWSLLAPSIDMSEALGLPKYLPPLVGFLLGGVFLWGVDRIIPHLHIGMPDSSREGIKTSWQRSVLLVLAITLHNIPEGLAVGVAFGAAAAGFPGATLAGAIALALGIGLQNFPEGLIVSLEEFSIWPSICTGRAHRRCIRCGGGYLHSAFAALCAGFCSWRHDLCGG